MYGGNRPLLDKMLDDMATRSRKEVTSNMEDRVGVKTTKDNFVYPTDNSNSYDNYENPFVCDYPFEPNPVKIGNNFACKLPTNETTQQELSYFETPWLHPYVADLAPPVMYNNVEKNILNNLIGKNAMDQITYVNTLGDTNMLPNRCPPYGFPDLIERVEVPKGSKRFICRAPMPSTEAISY